MKRGRRELILFLSAAVAAAVTTGCGDEPVSADSGPEDSADAKVHDAPVAGFDLTLQGTGFGALEGVSVKAALIESAVVLERGSATISGGNFTITWVDVLQPETDYYVAVFADVDGDGACSDPPADHMWRLDISDVEEDTVLQHSPETDYAPEVCFVFGGAPTLYDFGFSGTDYGAYDGLTIYGALVIGGEVVGTADDVIGEGEVDLLFPESVPEGAAFHLDYFIDLDGDTNCSAPPTDYMGRFDYPHPAEADLAIFVVCCADAVPEACTSF